MDQPRLVFREGPGSRRTIPITKDPFSMGRRQGNDLQVPARDVSKDHAEIRRAGERFVLRDLESSFGTFVNGERVSEHTLRHNDVIRLATTPGHEILFLIEDRPTLFSPDTPSSTALTDLRQLAVLLEGLRALSAGGVLDEILAFVLDAAIEMAGSERGFIMLGKAASELEFRMGRERGRRPLAGRIFKTSRKIPESVFATGRAKVIPDLEDEDPGDLHRDTKLLEIRRVVCLPLRPVRCVDESAAPQQVAPNIGVLYLDNRRPGSLPGKSAMSGLETLAAEAAMAIENARLYREALEKARLEDELRLAAGIQRMLVPRHRRRGRFYDAVGTTLPCRAIGGDFFDYLDLPDGGFGFAVADVSGKGAAAALLTAMVQGALRAHTRSADCGPAVALSRLNRDLHERGIESRYVTMLYAALDDAGHLRYSNGGHNPPLLIQGSTVTRLEQGGLPVGLFAAADYSQGEATLAPGDLLVLYSDGVSEASDAEGREFGEARILAKVLENRDAEPPQVLAGLVDAVSQFTAGAPQGDDLTAVVIRYTG